jgi:hypothetical protein
MKNINTYSHLTYAWIAFIFLSACGGGFRKSPLDEIIKERPREEVFSIILYDMDAEGSIFTTYHHQYQIVKEDRDGNVEEIVTDWHEVSEEEFNRYINDMGMEIAARDSTGQLTKDVAPPGYNNYVGNPKYGRWNYSGGSSFWVFYGQYAFLSSLFRTSMYPVYRPYYSDWHGNYRGTSRRYYGPSSGGTNYYGTGSGYSRTSNPSSTWNNRSSSFKNRVSNRVSRSSTRSQSKTSSRSRGGGFGK